MSDGGLRTPPRFSAEWVDCTDTYYVGMSVATGGGGYWPCMVSLDVDLEGSITAEDARSLAAMLERAANACDFESEREASV